jgi:thiol:disulfide interchange protein
MIAFLLALAFAVGPTFAAATVGKQDPVQWSAAVKATRAAAGETFDVAVTAVIEDEWHVYSVTQGPGGPIPTTIAIGAGQPFSRAGAIRGPAPVTAYDPNFDIQTETYDGTIRLVVPVRLARDVPGTSARLRLAVSYQACTNRLCLPPRTQMLDVPIRWSASASGSQPPASGSQLPASGSQLPASSSQLPASGSQPPASNLQPPTSALRATVGKPPVSFGQPADSWPAFLWLAITMGALSLLTPCVFPMVPITVSYFTNHAAGTRRAALGSALTYGIGIVLTFTVLGSALAAIAGAAGLNRFAANPWVNLAIAAMFVLFALNLFGVYDVRLPSRMLSTLDGASRRRGTSVSGTLLMAATFTVTSLTCTAAFLGTLLVVASQGEWQRPIAGLLAYSATFALPFVVLAAAPQFVSQLPRSGPWLARVKVVMGFLEIAAATKFLSNADLVWSWDVFTRGPVLMVWMATMLALAAYLAWPQGRPRRVAPGWLAAAAATLLFTIWLGTGLSGRRLGELEAFLPASTTHAFAGELPWITNDLDAALGEARASKRLVMIDFTGYTCTNCRWMEANMFPRAEVRAALDGFVRARLYTDGQGDVYERQQRFQQEQFRTVALPLYAIVDADRRPIATFAGLTRDPREFLAFLSEGRRAGVGSPAP